MTVFDVVVIETASLGDRSYIAHDGRSALVVDPPRDIDRIERELARRDLTLELILETHLHNDYISGGLTLSRTAHATYAHAAAETLHFERRGVSPGERITVGTMTVDAVATPGHTPHHLAYIVRVPGRPPAAFTGGSLLYGTVGRTDLVADDRTDDLTRAQYRSARTLAGMLPDDARIYPTHGFGSFCASARSDEDSDGTLATERRINLALTVEDEGEFVDRLVSGLTAYPAYYAHMAPINRAGGVAIDLSPPAPVDPVELVRRIHRGEWVVDLRSRTLFANEHLTGTIGIELEDGFATYLGWLIPWGMPLTLLADRADEIAEAQRQLVRIGIDRPAGAATGGIDTWGRHGDLRCYPVDKFSGLTTAGPVAVLDVRRTDEYDASHIDGAVNVPLNQLLDRLDEIPDRTLWVHCASGFRSSIAASILDRAGRPVTLIDDEYEHASDSGLVITSTS
jgi:glyoxylase-like metal-dependent hydrolase (beta-lactamase superfamily II)/rhodanese-related sulfurtransferase